MLESIDCRCTRCDHALDDEQFRLAMTTTAGTRHVYECGCGAVTVTVVAEDRIG